MTKSLEDLQTMEVGQLKGILTSLDVTIPELDYRKAENKERLAQLVYDVQQPEAPEQSEEDAADEAEGNEKRAEETAMDVDAELDAIAEFFGGELEPVGETEEEVIIFGVKSTDGNEIERGTFTELQERMATVKQQEADNAAAQKADEDAAVNPSVEEEVKADPEALGELDEALSGLKRLGLKYDVSQDSVKLRFGAKAVTTTLSQPVYRIVKTAEGLVKRR